MARNEFTPKDIDSIADELSDAVTSLRSLAESLRKANMPHALIHGTTTQNFHIPAVLDWIGKINVDIKTQIRAFAAGIQSRAELNKRYNERQKLAAAKKPFKAAKKKPN